MTSTRSLKMPALEELVDLQEGQYILDLATGNGLVARRMAAPGGYCYCH